MDNEKLLRRRSHYTFGAAMRFIFHYSLTKFNYQQFPLAYPLNHPTDLLVRLHQ